MFNMWLYNNNVMFMSREYYIKGISKSELISKIKSGSFTPLSYYTNKGLSGMKVGENYGWVESLENKPVLTFYGRNDDSKIIEVFQKYGAKLVETRDESSVVFSNLIKTPIVEKKFNFGNVF